VKCSDHEGAPPVPKLGYIDWHERAAEAYARGERQAQCDECRRWYFPFETVKPKASR
jgi:hypothetical protein